MDRRQFLGSLGWVPAWWSLNAHGGTETPVRLEPQGRTVRFFVAGVRFHVAAASARHLMDGTRALRLVREPDNPHDANAIAVLLGPHQIGYVPRALNAEPARRMDQGAPVNARLVRVDPDAPLWEAVEAEVGW